MKNGYYLSVYAVICKIGNLYCESNRHDNCMALWRLEDNKVSLVHYWELERLSGLKQQRMAFFDIDQFKVVTNNLLKPYNITLDDIEEIWGVPELNKSDKYLSKHRYNDITYHAISHLASCMFMDMEKLRSEKILAIAVDGGSDTVIDAYDKKGKSEDQRYQYCAAYSTGDLIHQNILPIYSPAIIWKMVAIYFGIKEGSLMALASASKSEAYIEVEDILVKNNVKEEKEKYEQVIEIIQQIENLTKEDEGVKFNYFDPRFSEKDNKISMVMKIIQRMSERIMTRNISEVIKKYNINPKETYLAMSGGFALNCPCNTYLLEEFGFKGFIAPPSVSDSGMALGIGLYAFYNELGNTFEFKLKNAYYGDNDDFKDFFIKGEYRHYIGSVEDFDENLAVSDLEEGPIVWFNGRAEIGPRALGARSILGDPRKTQTKDKLNEIKQRQWWRPVAPIVLMDRQKEWFENSCESPYMLHVLRIRKNKEELVPAIVHEDGTARVQTLDEKSGQELLLRLMKVFANKTGVPILCNTSLNDKGEPIINRIDEAINFALRKEIKVAYFNGKRIVLKNHKDYNETLPLKRPLRMAIWKTFDEREKLINRFNPYSISDRNIRMVYYTKKFDDQYFSQDYSKISKDIVLAKYSMKNIEHANLEFNYLINLSNQVLKSYK